jgi:hypothetical protein
MRIVPDFVSAAGKGPAQPTEREAQDTTGLLWVPDWVLNYLIATGAGTL